MKGFKKDGKFRPTGKRNKKALSKRDTVDVIQKRSDGHIIGIVEPNTQGSLVKKKSEILGINIPEEDVKRSNYGVQNDQSLKKAIKEISSGRDKQSLDDSNSDMIHYILQNTDDGDELSGQHLGLIEAGANRNLNDKGEKLLKELYEQVKSGHYELPAFHGIKNMTKDQEGFVYWKGKQIEHYSFDDYEDEKFSAKELEANILDLEAKGVKVTGSSIMDNYDNLRENQNQWQRTNYLVSPMENGLVVRSSNRDEGSDWTDGRDKQHAKEEYIRKHPNAKWDELEVLTNEEWNEKYPRNKKSIDKGKAGDVDDSCNICGKRMVAGSNHDHTSV